MNPSHYAAVGALILSATVAVVFVLTTLLVRPSRAARVLAISQFLAAANLTIAVSWGQRWQDPLIEVGAPLAIAVAAVALLWSGIRLYHDKPPLLGVSVAALALVVLAHAVETVTSGALTVTVAALLTIALLLAIAYELQVSPWSHEPPSRIMQAYFVLTVPMGLWWIVLAWSSGQGAVEALIGYAVLQTVAAMTLTALHHRFPRRASGAAGDGDHPLADLDVLAPSAFRTAAQGRLERVTLVGGHACFILVSVEDLRALNSAFGRALGDDAVRKLAETIRAHVPPWAPIGHLGAGNFAVLAPAISPQSATTIVAEIEESLLTSHTATVLGVRVGAVYGVADTFSSEPAYGSLLEQAIASMTASSHDPKSTLLNGPAGA